MSTPSRAPLALVLLPALLLATACRVTKTDDETARPAPTRTTTITAAPGPAPLPSAVPVGRGAVGPTDVVWAQGSTLHVGQRSWNLAPRAVGAFVVVAGGIFFLDQRQVWFTDLATVRAAGVSGAVMLATDKRATGIRVTTIQGGRTTTHAWSASTGRSVAPHTVVPATTADRLGTPDRVAFPAERRATGVLLAPVATRRGPGGWGVFGDESNPVMAYQIVTSEPVTLNRVVGTGFELVRWTGASTFYGLALDGGRPLATLGCDIRAALCTTYGQVRPGLPLVFESGS